MLSDIHGVIHHSTAVFRHDFKSGYIPEMLCLNSNVIFWKLSFSKMSGKCLS